MQVNSTTGPQSKAPAGMRIALTPCTTGEVLKKKSIVVLPFVITTEFAGAPFTVKSLASTVAGSTGSLTLTMKSVGAVPVTRLPHAGLVTEQGAGVGVGVGVTATDGSLSKKASCCETPLMATRPSVHEVRCLPAIAEP